MEQTVVKAQTTRTLGSSSSRRLRREGNLPGVLYGLGKDPIPVHVAYNELRDALKTEAGLNTVFRLDVEGTEDLVLVKDLQRHPIKRTPIHVDFLRIDAKQTISVDVPINLIGEAEEALNAGLLIDQILFALTVECSPTNIPDSLEVDISILTNDRNVVVSDIALPAGVETNVDADDPVVSTVVPRAAVDEEETTDDEDAEDGVEGEDAEASEEGAGDEEEE